VRPGMSNIFWIVTALCERSREAASNTLSMDFFPRTPTLRWIFFPYGKKSIVMWVFSIHGVTKLLYYFGSSSCCWCSWGEGGVQLRENRTDRTTSSSKSKQLISRSLSSPLNADFFEHLKHQHAFSNTQFSCQIYNYVFFLKHNLVKQNKFQ